MNCLICDSPLNEKGSCPVCGFDEGRDYESHPSLTPVEGAKPLSVLRADWPARDRDLLRCPGCGGHLFSFLPREQSAVCSSCGKLIPMPDLQLLLSRSAGSSGADSFREKAGSTSWEIAADGGTLVISGSDPMDDYGPCGAPWYRYRGTLNRVVIEEGVTSVGSNAFFGCLRLSAVTLPKGIRRLGEGAFCRCSKLETILLPETLSEIGSAAFKLCSCLERIRIPASVSFVGEEAFASCSEMDELSIASRKLFISPDAFEKCTSLRRVFFSGTESEWRAILVGHQSDALSGAEVLYKPVHTVDYGDHRP